MSTISDRAGEPDGKRPPSPGDDPRGDFGARGSILLVDDSATVRERYSRLLAGAGYAITEASTGAAALERATTTTPLLVLLDVVLPDMSGFEVCRLLREHPKTVDVPILYLLSLIHI